MLHIITHLKINQIIILRGCSRNIVIALILTEKFEAEKGA